MDFLLLRLPLVEPPTETALGQKPPEGIHICRIHYSHYAPDGAQMQALRAQTQVRVCGPLAEARPGSLRLIR